MRLELCVDCKACVYLSNKTNFIEIKFIEIELRGFFDFSHYWGSKGNIKKNSYIYIYIYI